MPTRTKADLRREQQAYADMKALVDPAVAELVRAAIAWQTHGLPTGNIQKYLKAVRDLNKAIDALVEATDEN